MDAASRFDFPAYQAAARVNAIYPDLGSNFTYPTLGLVGEACEVLEKVLSEVATDADIIKELGDTLWYLAQLAAETGVVPAAPLSPECPSSQLDSYAAKLVISAGRVAERVKKTHRDSAGELTDATLGALSGHLQEMLELLWTLAAAYGTDLAGVAAVNLAKLAARRQAGLIRGDGDNR